MLPEEALPIITALPGVKKARLYRKQKSDDPDQLKISYTPEEFRIAGMAFAIEPRLENRRLAQLWLSSKDQCSSNAISTLSDFSGGLTSKYPEIILEDEFDDIDLARANRAALPSGEGVSTTRIYGDKATVVVLTFSFSSEAPPRYPGLGNKFARALYQLARSNYEQRSRECAGTGRRRMDISLQYMKRETFAATADAVARSLQAEKAELADQF